MRAGGKQNKHTVGAEQVAAMRSAAAVVERKVQPLGTQAIAAGLRARGVGGGSGHRDGRGGPELWRLVRSQRFVLTQMACTGTPMMSEEELGQLQLRALTRDERLLPELEVEDQLPPCCWIVYPDSTFQQHWDLSQAALLVYIAITVPFRACFMHTRPMPAPQGWTFWIDALVDLFFVLDIGINFRTALVQPTAAAAGRGPREQHDDRYFLTNPGSIARKYLRGWFTIDCVSCLPMGYLQLVLEQDRGNKLGPRIWVNIFFNSVLMDPRKHLPV